MASLELVEGLKYSSAGSTIDQYATRKAVHLPYNILFMGDHDRTKGSKRILIVGEAGVGKTVLCASIVKDWANGKLFQEFLMVLLLPLNQKDVVSAENLPELIKHLHEFDSETCSTIAAYLMENKKDNVLIIADGWDKHCESDSQQESFLHRLLFGDLLPSSSLTIVIMSRSVPVTQQSISRFITLQGFSEKTAKSYIQYEFSSNPEKVRSITEQLETNPLVGSMCSVPLSLTMICNFCQTCDNPLPSTMPELYNKLITWNLARLKIYSIKEHESVLKLSNYRDLPDKLQRSWSQLCRLAFQKCQADFSQVLSSSFLFTELETFSLLKPATVESDEVMFSFLYPAFRYYLAISHLTTQPQNVQLEIIKSLGCISPMFCRFYLSVNENASSDIVSEIVKKLHHSCKDMCLLSFESKNEIVNREVTKALHASGSTIMFHSQNAYECMAMVHVLDKIEQPSNVEINFQKCKLKASQISNLASTLGDRSKMIQVKGLDLSDNNLNDTIVADFFSRAALAFSSLEKLFLRGSGIALKGLSAIVNALAKSSCKSLTQLDLSFNFLSVACLECFQQYIDQDNLQKMEILILKGSLAEDINASFLKCFAKTLSTKCQCLRQLDLSANKLGACDDSDLRDIVSRLTGTLGSSFNLRLDDDYMSEVEKNFLTIMEESIRTKGTIDHTIAHGVIVGPGRSGKNTLLKRLTGEGPPDPNVVSPSTGVLENVVKVEVKKLCEVASAKCNLKWRKLKYDEEALELMMTTAKNYSHLSNVPKPVIKYIYKKKSKSTEDKKPPLPTITKSNKISKRDTSKADKPKGPKSTTIDDTDSTQEESKHVTEYRSDMAPVDIFKKAVQLRHMDALREHLESSWSLYLTNTGGQIEFQEHLPLLVCGPSIFFVTFPLHYDLDKPYEVRYEYPDRSEEKYSSSSTLIQEILQTLATIYTLDYVTVQFRDEQVTLKPTVFIIGTHKDCLTDSEKIAKIDDELQRYVKQTSLYHQRSIQFASDFENCDNNCLIFTVNNLSKDDYDFQKIRFAVQQTVEERCQKQFTVQCPSSWLIFSLILREKHKSSRVLRLEDCLKIARECGISSYDELTTALSYIHSRLGLVRYFDVPELNSLVVVDPEILFDKITNLIVETFVGKNVNRKDIEEFRKKGIISVEIMKGISERSSEDAQLPFIWLMKLLNHLRLAALFKDEYGEHYFFPSALCHVPKAQHSSVESTSPNTSPSVVIAFETGFCPRGLAGALIKCLMTNEMNSKKSWYLLPRKISRNQVSFSIEAYGDITLKILPTHLEISLDPEEDNLEMENENSESGTEDSKKLTCEEAYTQISKCMKIVTSLYKKCEYFWTFYCTLSECKTIPHPAVIEWSRNQPSKLRCKISDKRTHLPKGYKIWNIQKKHKEGVIQLDTEVKERYLGKIADSMAEWEGPIADELKLSAIDVEEIKTKHHQNLKLQKREALKSWKTRNGSKATYSKLIKIFERARYKSYADEVRRIAQLSDSEADDSGGSGEEESQVKQPQAYPASKIQALSQLPPTMPKSTEIYMMIDEENLPKGHVGEVCSEKAPKSHNLTRSFVPKLTPSKSDGEQGHGEEIHHIEIQQSGKGFGFIISGGVEDNEPLRVHFIVNGGAADMDGRLRVYDEFLEINGNSTEGMLHGDAVAAVKHGGDVGKFVIRRLPAKNVHQAALRGQLDELKRLIEDEKLNPMEKDKNRDTILHCAAQRGHLNVLKYLIKERGLDPACQGGNGQTPLHRAAVSEHLELVKYLVGENQVDPLCQDEDGYTPLHSACAGGDINVIQYLISEMKKHTSLDSIVYDRNKDGSTAVHLAALEGHLPVVKLFISELNCDPNTPGFVGRPPLVSAAQGGHLDIVRYLIEELHCDPSYVPDEDKVTPLHMAALWGHLDVIRYLTLNRKCSPLIRDSRGNTPLHLAAFNGQCEAVKLFISELNCDPNTPGLMDRPPLVDAAEGGHLDVVRYLIEELQCDPSYAPGEDKNTPLHAAALGGHLDVIRYLTFNRNCSPLIRDSRGDTPLHLAAFYGQCEAVKLFISELNCDPNIPGLMDRPPLVRAAEGGYLDVVRYLIEELQCDPSYIAGEDKDTPLHVAAAKGYLDVIRYLTLNRNCSPLIRDSHGDTPLHLAAFYGQYEAVKLFISELNCDPNTPDNMGRPPLVDAAEGGHLDVVRYLIEELQCDPSYVHVAGEDKATPLHAAATKGHLDVIRYLTLNRNCSPLIRDSDGNTPLHLAALYGQYEAVKLFISELNCDPNTPGQWGRTPLHSASQEGHFNIVEYLIDIRKCSPASLDNQEATPLHVASLHGHLHIVKYLIEDKHCDPLCYDKVHGTPLHWATMYGQLEIVEYLVEVYKCPVNTRNSDNKTPLELAQDQGHTNVVQYLSSLHVD